MSVELIPKRIDQLVAAVPGTNRIALLINGNFEWGVRRNQEEGESAGARHGIKVEAFLIRTLADFKPVMAAIKKSDAHGIVVAQDGRFYANMSMLAQLAIDHQLPMMAYSKEMVQAGALLRMDRCDIRESTRGREDHIRKLVLASAEAMSLGDGGHGTHGPLCGPCRPCGCRDRRRDLRRNRQIGSCTGDGHVHGVEEIPKGQPRHRPLRSHVHGASLVPKEASLHP